MIRRWWREWMRKRTAASVELHPSAHVPGPLLPKYLWPDLAEKDNDE